MRTARAASAAAPAVRKKRIETCTLEQLTEDLAEGQVFAALDLATALAFAHSQTTGSASGGDDGSSQMDTAYIAMVIVVVLVIVVVTDDDA